MANNGSSGVGFTGLLQVLLIGLKLGGVIEWPWLWVLAPLWVSVGVTLALIALALGVIRVGRRAG